MKILRLFICLVTLFLTACMSHLFIDTTTRLQLENKTDYTIVGLDVLSEDGLSIRPWIQDTILPGEKSRVVEEEWVGTFHVKVKWKTNVVSCWAWVSPKKNLETIGNVALAKQDESSADESDSGSGCFSLDSLSTLDLDFEGGSLYLVVSQDEKGKPQFKFR